LITASIIVLRADNACPYEQCLINCSFLKGSVVLGNDIVR
jgi:hypothetical protein